MSSQSDGGAFGRSGWVEEIERIDRAGDVHVRLRKGDRSLTLQLSAVGTHPHRLSRTQFGDVSYSEVLGLSEAAAVKLARAYAARLNAAASPLPGLLPHLAIAAAGGRTPGSCRAAIAALWPRDLTLPAACAELRLDPAGLREFLAPELCVDGAPFAGFVLRSVGVMQTSASSRECVLELQPASGSQASEPVLIAVAGSWAEGESFGAAQAVSLAVRRGGTDGYGNLLPEAARLCSLLAALLELKQSAAFTVRLPDLGAVSAPILPPGRTAPAPQATPGAGLPRPDNDIHRFAILSSGYTILRQVLPAGELVQIAAAVDRALQAMQAAADAGRDISYTFYDKDTYLGTRCIYCWGEACVRLIENDLIRSICQAVIGPHKLFDMSAHRALPAARFGPERTEEWHRDIDVFEDTPPNVRYLWFFVPLDEFTAENGATWVVPGSQRLPNTAVPRKGAHAERFPTRVQLVGRPGDLFVLNPSALHSVGHNATARPRTMINLGACHTTIRPLLDHWAIAGPAIHEHASERLRSMLGAAGEAALDTTWSVLPEGWKTSARTTANDPATRVFPPEQQGYQRSHRIRDPE